MDHMDKDALLYIFWIELLVLKLKSLLVQLYELSSGCANVLSLHIYFVSKAFSVYCLYAYISYFSKKIYY